MCLIWSNILRLPTGNNVCRIREYRMYICFMSLDNCNIQAANKVLTKNSADEKVKFRMENGAACIIINLGMYKAGC